MIIHFISKYKKTLALLFSATILSLILAPYIVRSNNQNIGLAQDNFGDAYAGAQQFTVSNFSGYQTDVDETKLPNGANGRGQNTTANDGDRISVRNLGYELFPSGTASTTESPIQSMHTFRRRSGENIMMVTHSDKVYYFEEGNDTWEVLKSGLTEDQKFGFADFNVNNEQRSYVYFGNAVDTAMRWAGAHTLTNGTPTSTTLMVDDTSGFEQSGTLILCNEEISYTSATVNTFILSATPTACFDNRSVAQAVDLRAESPIGNIYLTSNNRLFISGVSSSTQAVWFSDYGDPLTWYDALVTDSTADSGGVFNLVEGGGGVIGMVQDEGAIYIFKKSIIYKVTLSDSLYTLEPLKPFDGKGQTIGALNNKSIFTGGNGVYFITPDHQIMELARVETVDYPQVTPISDKIEETLKDIDFDSSSGIVYQDKAYFSVKSDSDLTFNDTILVWNTREKIWDSPVVGFNASDFSVYNDGTNEELYFGEDISPNVYKVTESALDGAFGVTANWRSKQFNFDMPYAQKEILDVFVEGYISQSTTLTISLLLDEDGYTQSFSTDLAGTDSQYIYNSEDYNVFGLSSFGTKRFGSNDDFGSKNKFRIYLGKNFRASPFYNASIDFASDGENQDWEITSFSFKYRPYSEESKRELYKAFQ